MAGLEISEDLDLSNLNQKEKIILLDKVFFKILSSESDLDFETNLETFLPKLLLKLGTSEDLIRKKIMEILVHVNKRIRSRPDVRLPFNDLISIFNDSALNNLSFVTNFSLIYIKLAFPRLSSNEKAEQLGKVLKCIEGKSVAHQDSILSLIVGGLRYLELKPNDPVNKLKFGFSDSPKLRKQFLDYLFYFLLLPYATNKQPAATPAAPPTSPVQEIPACLSEAIYKRFKTDVNLEDGDELERTKIGILKFLAMNIYECDELIFHFIVSTSDTRYAVVEMAELHVKRIAGGCDLNEAGIVSRFFQIFLGDNKAMPIKKASSDADVVQPSNTRIRLKLFPYILRSRQASCTIPQALQLVFDALFGPVFSTNNKIKLYAVQFVHNIAQFCPADSLLKVGAVLIQGMNKVIANSKDDSKIRGLAYVAVGKLARKIPNTVSTDISIVHSFFSALSTEELDIKMHIQEALVLMIDAFCQSKPEEKNLLLTLLFQYIENDTSQCRAMAVKYAFEIYEQDQLDSRYLLLLASSDPKEEIRQEAGKYLRRTHDADGNAYKMATFEHWVDFIAGKSEERLRTKYKNYTFGTHTLAFEPNCYEEILAILRMALSTSADLKPQLIDAKALETIKDEACLVVEYVKALGGRNLNTLFKYLNIIKEYALTVANALGIYLLLEICSIAPVNITQLLYENIDWLKNQAFSLNDQVRTFSAELWSLVLVNNLLQQQQQDINFSKLFNELTAIKDRVLLNPAKSFEAKHGGILCIGYALGRYLAAIKSNTPSLGDSRNVMDLTMSIVSFLDDPNLATAAILSIGEMARNGPLLFDSREHKLDTVETLIKKIHTSKETNKVKERAAATLGFMCLHEANQEQLQPETAYCIDKKHYDTFSKFVMQKLLNSSQAKQIELHMSIGEALANCALGQRSLACLNPWKVNLKDELSGPQVFCADPLSDRNMEWLLSELLGTYIPSPNQHLRQAACFWLLTFIKKCAKSGQVVQKSLMRIQEVFMSRLGDSDEVTQEVASKGIGLVAMLAGPEQKKMLVERLVETLSGGPGKSKVNRGAIESGLKIEDENAEIFGGEIGKAPDGSNIGSYKELCSLASDMNRPDLIYQFMNLAHHNTIWNTRRGAAFGFNTIADLANEQLQPYIKDLVPKLFRYQFDPNPKIQQSMTAIWDSLITKENKKVIDLHLEDILLDIEKNMHSNLWRVRESCSNALCDLLKGGRNLESISGKFGTFWSLLFKLADDIKESVRTSAALTLKSLQRVTISYSTSVSNRKICEQTVDSVLPILIKTGLQGPIEEVRSISVLTIRDLAKHTTSALIKPYLVDLIVSLLETLSGYEPPDLNYISLKLNSADAQEKLDMARIAASKNTPMIEIINTNIDNLNDEAIIGELVPKLLEIVKRGLGVSTKAGVCHIICSLVDQQPDKMAPYSGKILAALVNSMASEHNKTINKQYCAAIGSVSKVAKDSSIENLLNKLQDWYFEKEDAGIKLSCGLTLFSIVQNNFDAMAKFAKKYTPFTFFAMHEQTESQMKLKQRQLDYEQQNQFKTDYETRSQMPQAPINAPQSGSIWIELWEEITSGTEYAIRANLSEILRFVKMGLEHKGWDMKIQAALTICTICTRLQSNIDPESLNELIDMLVATLNTRTWNGKDKVLIAVSCLFSNCKLSLKFENKRVEEIYKCIFKEASKKSDNIDVLYRVCALRTLTDLVQFSSVQCVDSGFEQYWSAFFQVYFEETIEILRKKESQRYQQQLESLINKTESVSLTSDSEVETEKTETESIKVEEEVVIDPALEQLKLVCLETIGKCWTCTPEVQEKYLYDAVLVMSDGLGKLAWSEQQKIIRSFQTLFDRWSIEFEERNVEVIIKSIELACSSIISCIAKTKYSILRREGLNMLEKLFELLTNEIQTNKNWPVMMSGTKTSSEESKQTNFIMRQFLVEKIVDSLRVLFEEFTSDANLDIREKSKTLLKVLNTQF